MKHEMYTNSFRNITKVSKRLITILLLLPFIGFAQNTYVPDDNFEQLLIFQGYDNVLDDSVLTSNINQITNLQIANSNISDLTGIEDFSTLSYLYCPGNQLTILDVSSLHNLDTLKCGENLLIGLHLPDSIKLLECPNNQLTSLDVSNNIYLEKLICSWNPLISLTINDSLLSLQCTHTTLTSIDLSNNDKLEKAILNDNQISSVNTSNSISLKTLLLHNNLTNLLDISSNINLEVLSLNNNNFSELDLRNGNNINMQFVAASNPNLNCISVDDTVWAYNNWTVAGGFIDQQHYFSNNCNSLSSITESHNQNKTLLKVTDLLGREVHPEKVIANTTLFYIYDDGTVEKKLVIE